MRRPHLVALATAILIAGAGFSPARADTKEPAKVLAIQVYGTVNVAHGKGATAVPVRDNDALAAGDIVETAVQSGVVLVLPNGSTMALKERSRLAITVALQSPFAAPDLVAYDNTKKEPSTSSTSLELMFGTVVAQVRKLIGGSDLSVKTPVGSAAIRGTEFEMSYTEDAAGEANYRLSTASGLVVFSPVEGPPVEAAANRQIEFRARVGKAGVKLQPIQARDLPVEARRRIQQQNQAVVRDVGPTLQRMKALREARSAPEARNARPGPPPTDAADLSRRAGGATDPGPAAAGNGVPGDRPPQTKPANPPTRDKPPATPPRKKTDPPPNRPGGG